MSDLQQSDKPDERKPAARNMTLLLCLNEFRHHLAKEHNQGPLLAECPKCQEISAVDALISEATAQRPSAATPDVHGLLGNLLDHWERVPNDIKSDPGMDSLNAAMRDANTALGGTTK